MIWWLSDTVDHSWQIEKLISWHWGYVTIIREWLGQHSQFLRCFVRAELVLIFRLLWYDLKEKKVKNIFFQNTIIVQSLFAVFLSFNESRAEENLGVVRMPQAENKISSSANYNSVGNYSTTTTTVVGSGTISKCQHSRITSVAWKT